MKKTLLCILSFLPTALIFMGMVTLIIITGFQNSGFDTGVVVTILQILALLIEIVGIILGAVMMIIYIVKTIKNKNLSVGMKVLWVVLLLYLSVFLFAILPVYWFVVLRKEQV